MVDSEPFAETGRSNQPTCFSKALIIKHLRKTQISERSDRGGAGGVLPRQRMSAAARTPEAGPKDKGREGRGTLGAAPLIKQSGGLAAQIPVEASNEKCWPQPAIFVASTGIEPVFKV